MTAVYSLPEIRSALARVDVVAAMERALVAYSGGRAVVPPVGELLFDDPPGDVHIKYGYVGGEEFYVIKVASGFYHNPALGLASSNGLMLLFRQRTGELAAVLLDEGHLTDVRTGAAGAVAARHLAPPAPACIGILGCGVQAEQQLRHLALVTPCREVLLWGRDRAAREAFAARLADTDFRIGTTDRIEAIVERCRLIVTATPSTSPLLQAALPGTHITAVGSDTATKQELAPALLACADIVAVDSLAQSASRGEVYRAVQSGALSMDPVLELGAIVAGDAAGREDDKQITVADLTGVATEDIEIATAIYRGLQHAD